MTESPLGILGGIFDPVHNGHLSIASLATGYFNLDKVLFIPSGVPPHKLATVTATPEQRLKMLELAIEGNSRMSIWDGEIARGGLSFTVDTLSTLQNEYPGRQLYFIIGSDNLKEIMAWRDYKTIFSLATICVAHRPGYAQKIPFELKNVRIKMFPSPEWGISSTMVRTYLKHGYNCRFLIPDPVLDYINDKELYLK